MSGKYLYLLILFCSLGHLHKVMALDYRPVSMQRDVEYSSNGEKKIHGVLKLFESSSNKAIDFEYDFYAPADRPSDRLVVITPNIDGATPLEYFLKDYLVNRGFSVLIAYALEMNFTYDSTTAAQFERESVRAQMGTTRLIEELGRTESFDKQSIGLLGASLGGIRSAILFGLDDRFKAMFIAVAGADFPSIYANSTNSVLRPIRAAHMEYLGLRNTSSYERYLRARLKLDPSLVIKSPNLENVAMVIAENDRIVPTYNQWQLWTLIKNTGVHPKTYISESGHVRGALHLLRYRSDIVQWFKDRL